MWLEGATKMAKYGRGFGGGELLRWERRGKNERNGRRGV
jgi:hypothetical protein